MASKNPITNDLLQSRIYSSEGRDRHEKIFAKRTFNDWLDIQGLDDICRDNTQELISYSEFRAMLVEYLDQ